MVSVAFAWVFGIMLSHVVRMPWFVCVGLIGLGLKGRCPQNTWIIVLRLLAVVCVSWGLASVRAEHIVMPQGIQHGWRGEIVRVISRRANRFDVQLKDRSGQSMASNMPTHLKGQTLEAGHWIQCDVARFKSVRAHLNPGARLNQASDRGYVKLQGCRVLKKKSTHTAAFRVYLQQLLFGAHLGVFRSVMMAWVKGDASEISKTQWAVFRRTGTAHLLAISGLHMGLLFRVVRWSLRATCASMLMRRLSGTLIVDGLALCVSLAYTAWVGWPIAAQRALMMLGVMFGLNLWGCQWPLLWVWSITLIVLTLVEPNAIFSPGFWLSFWGVWVLITTQYWQRSHWRTQCAIFCGLSSISMGFFHHIALISLVANMIAIPVVTLWVVPLSLMGLCCALMVPSVAVYCWSAAVAGLKLLWPILNALSHWGYVACPTAPMWAYVLGLLGMAIVWMPGVWPIRYWGLVLCLPMWCVADHPTVRSGELLMTVLDVGQGLSVAVHTAHHTLLYDTGPRWQHWNAGAYVILPYLQWMGIRKIDVMMISHGDLDHRGGAEAVLSSMHVDQLMTSVPERFMGAVPCHAGQQWRWEGVDFEVLAPPYLGGRWTGNNGSCVLKVQIGSKRVLLTGDIEKPSEHWLVAQGLGPMEGLVVPHHGSLTSSSPEFLERVKPKWAVIASGWHNRFHLPNALVLRRYQARHIQVFDTQDRGAVRVHMAPTAHTQIKAMRSSQLDATG